MHQHKKDSFSRTAFKIVSICVVCLFTIAALLFWQAHRMGEAIQPPIPGLAIDVNRSTTKTPEFIVKSDGRYLITATIDGDFGMRNHGCLLGVWLDKRDCDTANPPVILSWSLVTDGTVSQQGQSFPNGSGAWNGQHIENTFGEFLATPGRKYEVHIAVPPEAAVLARANLHISVHLGRREFEDRLLAASLRAYASIAIAGLALILLFASEVAQSVIRRLATTADSKI